VEKPLNNEGNNASPIEETIARKVGNVSMRFEPYAYIEPPFDLQAAIIRRLDLKGGEKIIDVGDYNGSFLYRLKTQEIHKGDLIGVDPHRHLRMHLVEVGESFFFVNPDSFAQNELEGQENLKLKFLSGIAQNLPVDDNSADVLSALFMMYFIPQQEQMQVLQEFKRVLKPEGRLVLTTSGDFNKPRHRLFEELIADSLGIAPPVRMNDGFDSERAAALLPTVFKNVYHCSYKGRMVFKTLQEARAYYHSLLSMSDHFDPPISPETMKAQFDTIVLPIIQKEIDTLGNFSDYVERDMFICSDDSAGLLVTEPGRKKKVRGYEYREPVEAKPSIFTTLLNDKDLNITARHLLEY